MSKPGFSGDEFEGVKTMFKKLPLALMMGAALSAGNAYGLGKTGYIGAVRVY